MGQVLELPVYLDFVIVFGWFPLYCCYKVCLLKKRKSEIDSVKELRQIFETY